MKATDKFQSNRYKNADELLEDLQNIEFVTKMVGCLLYTSDHPTGQGQEQGEKGDLFAGEDGGSGARYRRAAAGKNKR